MANNQPSGALSSIKVLEIGRVIAAPWAGQTLGDLGADVIKVEQPGTGDMARTYGLARIIDDQGKPTRESTTYMCANRNKRSITLDISSPEGSDIVRKLAADCDVFIENFVGDTMERYGLDYATLSKINPRLVYCSITGFGHDGPASDRPGMDPIFQAMSGLMAVTGNPDSEPGGGPMLTAPTIIDAMTGMNATSAILAALFYRATVSGRGQYIDMTLLDTAFASQCNLVQGYLVSKQQPPRNGTRGPTGGGSGAYRCADGDIYIAIASDKMFNALCAILGTPELAEDPRFSNHANRGRHRDFLLSVFKPLIAEWKRDDLLLECTKADILASPVNGYEAAFADPQVMHRGIKVTVDHPLSPSGTVDLVASPMRLSETPVTHYTHPPLLGEHTDQILQERLGMDEAGIARLREQGII